MTELWIQTASILVLKALVLGRWAAGSWLWRSLIALVLFSVLSRIMNDLFKTPPALDYCV
jgi:hypothetical protein